MRSSLKIKPMLLWLFGALLFVGIYFFPIWYIKLTAPQYPEGLILYIGIDEIYGATESTIQNFNLLNHYVGMQYIEPDSFQELVYMPWIVLFFIVSGVLGALFRKKWALYAWVVLVIIAGTVGLIDFYLWEYEYGHNLDPTAPIKIEGMAYQPPFIGRKQLLNFVAYSYPHIGAAFFGAGLMLSSVGAFLQFKKDRK